MKARLLADPGYPGLKQRLIELTGLAYYADKDYDLAMRIAQRLSATGVRDCASYVRLLENRLDEMHALIGELTIGETYFFRQPEHFDLLRNMVFPDLIERHQATRRLRIWSAGCATGAEPYSVALLLRAELADSLVGWDVSIVGTDINREFLARARVAKFGNWAFRAGPKDLRSRYFEPAGKEWVLRPEFRQRVTFEPHNLVRDSCPAEFDLILCRNVMIYFGPEVIRSTVERLHAGLSQGGWLLVGHAELSTETFRAFRTVNVEGVTIYQKAPPSAVEVEKKSVPAWQAPPPKKAQAKANQRKPPVQRHEPATSIDEIRKLADRGEWQQAASLCRALLENDSLNAAAHFTLGLVLEHSGAAAEAEQSFKRTIYLDRLFALAHFHLGTLLARDKRLGQARRAFENVLDLLTARPDQELLEYGDGITAAQLKELAKMHLELLE